MMKLGFDLTGSVILEKLFPLFLHCLICEMGVSLSLAGLVYESGQLLPELSC